MQLKAHSKLGASSYTRWKACPGSVRACEGIPSVSSIYAEEGTLAHTVGEAILRGEPVADDIPDDMLPAVETYVDHVTSLRQMKPSFEAIEQKFHLKDYHPELYGTADYVAYFSRVKTLHVVDYKHGRGIPVNVKANKQLMYYGLGALNSLKLPIDKVLLTIVQPRCYHPDGPVRSFEVDSIEMVEFSFELIDDALATEKSDAPLRAGEHCRFCPAAPTCPALAASVKESVAAAFGDESETAVLPAMATLPADRLAFYLERIPLIEDWCSAVNKYAHRMAEMGQTIPGFKLVDKVARRKWAEGTEVSELASTLELYPENFFESKLKSPAAVEKLIPKDKRFLLDQFVVKESSGKTLVPTGDERPAIDGGISTMFQDES